MPVTLAIPMLYSVDIHIPRIKDSKAIANSPVGQVLAGPLFLKVKTKFHFAKSKQ